MAYLYIWYILCIYPSFYFFSQAGPPKKLCILHNIYPCNRLKLFSYESKIGIQYLLNDLLVSERLEDVEDDEDEVGSPRHRDNLSTTTFNIPLDHGLYRKDA